MTKAASSTGRRDSTRNALRQVCRYSLAIKSEPFSEPVKTRMHGPQRCLSIPARPDVIPLEGAGVRRIVIVIGESDIEIAYLRPDSPP